MKNYGCKLIGLCFLVTAANAAPDQAESVSANSNPVLQLEKYSVSDVPPDNQILPTVRPVSDILGYSANVLEIPRSVTTVNKAWMEERNVANAMDFGQFAPGVYSPARYGVPATPQVRGDNAQIYLNGQATLYTAQSILPSFNGVEAMDIVKGPGGPVYGPQSQAPGGYANFVTKQPFFDRTHETVVLTFGDWTSGKAHSNPEATLDLSGPINDHLAYRFSYLSRYGDSYYQNSPNQTQDFFAALTYVPNEKIRLEWWGQWYGSYFVDVTGTNRVTQEFIDHGTYLGGSAFAYPIDPPYGIGVATGAYAVLDDTTAYRTKLSADKVLVAQGDSARTGRLQTQFIATLFLPGDRKLTNRVYLEDADDREYNRSGYSEYMPVQRSIQDRLEFSRDISVGETKHQLIAGADFRYTRIVAYQDYSVEPLFFFDLNRPSSEIAVPNLASLQGTLGGGYTVPGTSEYSAYLPGSSGNQDSHIYDSAVFIQDSIHWGKKFTTILGTRLDHLKADAANPRLVQVFDPVTGTVFSPGVNVPKGSLYQASGTANNPEWFLSTVFSLTETRSFYFTFNQVHSLLGSANFGGVGVSLITDGANTATGTPADYARQLATSLRTENQLYEIGYKESFLGNTLYLGASLYQQEKSQPQLQGDPFRVKSRGLELELVYQPSKSLSFNANFTYQQVTNYAAGFYQSTNNYLDGFPVGFMVDGQSGTADGSPNYSSVPSTNYSGFYTPPNGRVRAPGVPQVLGNFFVSYQWASGFGAGVGPQIQGAQNANYQGTLRIPAQYQLDGYAFYRAKTWEVRLNVKNITNQRLLDPTDVTFVGNDAILVRPPISASLTLRYRF